VIQAWHLYLGAPAHRYIPPGTITRAHWVGLITLALTVLGGVLQVRALQQMPRLRAAMKGGIVLTLLLESLGLLSGRGMWSLPGLNPRAFCIALAIAAMLL
jgi:hypothetical protein